MSERYLLRELGTAPPENFLVVGKLSYMYRKKTKVGPSSGNRIFCSSSINVYGMKIIMSLFYFCFCLRSKAKDVNNHGPKSYNDSIGKPYERVPPSKTQFACKRP